MQTFMPYGSFLLSVKCLDNKRLGKQRVEAKQILDTLEGRSKGWRHHPAVKMWRGYESGLKLYHNFCIVEWIGRGFKNTMPMFDDAKFIYPIWMNDKAFILSHRSNLLRKDPVWYGKFEWNIPDDLPYVWPVK